MEVNINCMLNLLVQVYSVKKKLMVIVGVGGGALYRDLQYDLDTDRYFRYNRVQLV